MGGLAGIIKLDGSHVEESDLKRAVNILRHRGPNGHGVHLDREFGMAHTRMAITDTSDNGRQPMCAIGGRYWISFDGELYNFIELRDQLAKRGYSFRSRSDTEVVLAAFVAWGLECIQQFNGVWAFAVWDSQERVLTLSRDAFGVKPLYYFLDKRQFAYVSEVKGLLGIESIQLRYDNGGVAFTIANSPLVYATEYTPWARVKMVLPGHFLQFHAAWGDIKSIRWWNPIENLPAVPSHPVERTEVFHTLLKKACRLRMRGDVPLGVCLSGGLSSSTIWSTIEKLHQVDFAGKVPGKILAMSIESLSADVKEYANVGRLVKKSQFVELRREELHPDDFIKYIKSMIYSFELLEDLSVERWLLYYSLSQSRVHLNMDGAGANELLGRSGAAIQYYAYDCINQLTSARKALSGSQQWKEWILQGRLPKMSKFNPQKALSTADFINGFNKECLIGSAQEARLPYWEYDKDFLTQQSLFFQAKYFLSHCGVLQAQLRKMDAAAGSHGVQVRFPFLDPELFCYCLALPSECAVNQGRTQAILRGVKKESVPNENQYYLPRLHIEWLNGKLQGLVRDCAANFDFLSFSNFDGKKAKLLVLEKRYKDAWPYIQGFLLHEQFSETREVLFPEG